MKRLLSGFLMPALVAAGLVTVALPAPAEAQMRELRFAEFGPNRGTRAAALEWLDQEMRDRSGGTLGLNITWGGALLGAKTAAQGLSDGVADMASIVPVYAPGQLVAYEVVDTIQFGDEWVGMMATYELMTTNEAALAEQKKANIKYFGNYTTGPTQLLMRDTPVATAADLDGKTIRATGAFVPALEAKGASTVSMSQPKVYEAISNGSVDGSTTYYYVAKAYKHYEVADYITALDMGQVLAFGIGMNMNTYMSLTPEQQALVDELGRDFTVYMAEKMYTSRTETRAELEAGIDGHKIEIVEPTAELRAALVKVANEDVASWKEKASEKGLDAGGVYDAFAALVDKYTAARDADGYPWDVKSN
ncbi:TRAP transporter substrate-binding protein DctP [Aestuariivita sp.]|jgi:TRAP-type C4-dicarboxylate transport system substrate-binding protein|uniref:TRAP transporter substrate-binding protein DctP n=1 Tax=Aestuariivita sp. TaxID=1872407 RepID=UPI0021727A49|nr:TRAP transporter substrate-binding protein DctP [Aestuariivita sp.]MCE8005568.1 TRAP transporter substrate-binding protein DctP [Aestuariivita sp.]